MLFFIHPKIYNKFLKKQKNKSFKVEKQIPFNKKLKKKTEYPLSI